MTHWFRINSAAEWSRYLQRIYLIEEGLPRPESFPFFVNVVAFSELRKLDRSLVSFVTTEDAARLLEPRPDWGAVYVTPPGTEIRASGDCVCAACGKPYRDHPHTDDRDWNGEPFLHKLCDGTAVKL